MNIHPTAKRFGIAAAITLASFATSSTYAQLLAYEGFDAPPFTIGGDINGNGSGIGWGTNTWSGSVVYDSVNPGLTYSDGSDSLQTTGLNLSASGTNATIQRLFDSPVAITEGSTFYYSLIYNATGQGTGGNSVYFAALDGNSLADQAFTFGNLFNNGNVRFRPDGGGNTYLDTTVASGTTGFFVIKIQFSLVGNETISLFANPVIGGAEPTPIASSSSLNIDSTTLNGFSFQALGSNSKTLLADEIRFGTTWESVTPVPEPSTVAMLFGAAAFVLFRLRRRQSATLA